MRNHLNIKKPGKRYRLALASLFSAFITVPLGSSTMAQTPSKVSSDKLKAAFLYNFAKFTSWPTTNDLDTSIQFCVQKDTISKDSFKGWERKKIQRRSVSITFFEEFDTRILSSCSIMYFGENIEDAVVTNIKQMATENSILLVSDLENFSRAGGQIELYLADRKLRFKVNLGSLNDAELSLGAGVLRLAEIVKTDGEQ